METEAFQLLRGKVPDAAARRELVMKGEKMTAAEAVRRGVVDAAVDGGADDVVAAAVALAEELAGRGWDGETVAETRKTTWPRYGERSRTTAVRHRRGRVCSSGPFRGEGGADAPGTVGTAEEGEGGAGKGGGASGGKRKSSDIVSGPGSEDGSFEHTRKE
ncbi:hypothetical protein U9M48_037625 [Paspalum notatum var. saurae]|uniref:Uncharacterized protein n=1 Tax=Paspalum notatum var. saurae TaxID=547442 RepID=A0AAQ3UK52_PASNO